MLANKNKNKRFLSFINANSSSLNSGSSVIKAVVESVLPPKNPDNKWSPHRLVATCVEGNDTTITVKTKNAKAPSSNSKRMKTENGSVATGPTDVDSLIKAVQEAEGNKMDTENEVPKSVVVKSNQQIWVQVQDKNQVARLKPPCVVKLAITADFFMGRPQYRCSRIIASAEDSTLLNYKNFNEYYGKLDILRLPIVENIREDQNYLNFVLPLSQNAWYDETDIVIDGEDPDRCVGLKANEDGGYDKFCGFNTLQNFKERSCFSIQYLTKKTSENDTQDRVFVSLGYTSTLFDVFGITTLEDWKRVGARIFCNAQNAFASGYTSRDKIEALEYRASGESTTDEDGHPINMTTGFLTNMHVDMAKTAKASGVALDKDWVIEHLTGADSKHSFEKDIAKHALNQSFINRFKNGEDMVVNLSEISGFYLSKWFALVNKPEFKTKNVEFWGVFQENDIYEHTGDKMQKIKDERKCPVVIYATVSKKTKNTTVKPKAVVVKEEPKPVVVKEEPKPTKVKEEPKEEPKVEVKEEPKPTTIKEEPKPTKVKEEPKEEPKVEVKEEPKPTTIKEEPKVESTKPAEVKEEVKEEQKPTQVKEEEPKEEAKMEVDS